MRISVAGALLLAAACGNIGSPLITSTDVYEFRDVELGDTIVFHWPRSAMPVRVWGASDSPILGDVETAIARWQSAFLYGEFRATLVADSSTADVIVRNTVSDVGTGLGSRARECSGETESFIDFVAHTAQLPIHVFVYAAASNPGPGLATCYSITTTHEFGHVLGIINPAHAGTTTADVMYPDPTFDGISDRVRSTVLTLYLVPSNITITGRR